MKNNHTYIDGLQYALPTREYFQAARQTGLDLIHVTVAFWENSSDSLSLIGDWFRRFDSHADLIYPATDVSGLTLAADDSLSPAGEDDREGLGRLAVLFGFQNCSPIENNLDLIELYRRLNVGVMQLSYNNQSPLCGGCYEAANIGLSRFGKNAIREMNRVGMIIDLSHSSAQATLDAIEHSTRPIAITHAESLSFRRSVRNKSDDIIKAVAASGGMFGLSFYPFHLKNTSNCTLTDMMDEMKRLIDLIGINHIAIGSDICQGRSEAELDAMRNGHWTKQKDFGEGSAQHSGWPKPVSWFRHISDFGKLESALIAHGFRHDEAEKIMGANWYRFLQQSLVAQ